MESEKVVQCVKCHGKEVCVCQEVEIKEEPEDMEEDQEEDDEEQEQEKMLKQETDVSSPEYLASLPPGWSVRKLQVGFGSIIKKFVCPGGKEYLGRVGAIRRLSGLEGRREEAAILRAGLAADGWMQHPLLPGQAPSSASPSCC